MPEPTNEASPALPHQANAPHTPPRIPRIRGRIEDGGMRARAKALVRIKYLELSDDDRMNFARDWEEDVPNDFMDNNRDWVIETLTQEFSHVPDFDGHLAAITRQFDLMTPNEEIRRTLYGEPAGLPLLLSGGPMAYPLAPAPPAPSNQSNINVIDPERGNVLIRRLGG